VRETIQPGHQTGNQTRDISTKTQESELHTMMRLWMRRTFPQRPPTSLCDTRQMYNWTLPWKRKYQHEREREKERRKENYWLTELEFHSEGLWVRNPPAPVRFFVIPFAFHTPNEVWTLYTRCILILHRGSDTTLICSSHRPVFIFIRLENRFQ
jgi:hypothetical protein